MGRRISVRRRKPKRSALRGIVRRYPRQGHTTAVAPLLALRSARIGCTGIFECSPRDVVKKPNPKRNKTVDALLDPYLA